MAIIFGAGSKPNVLAKSTLHTWWDELYAIPGPQRGSILKESGTAGVMDALGGNMQIIMESKSQSSKKKVGR